MIRFFRIFIFSQIVLLFFYGCTKLDTTSLGGDLLPVVDNVNTFADTLSITTTQGVFNDTTKISRLDLHVLGNIPADPLFGETRANVYLQLKPSFYPYYYGRANDTINSTLASGTGFDSVVLCLSYKGFWGDSSVPLQLQVVQVSNNNLTWDSVFQTKNINYAPSTSGVLGNATVDARTLKNVIKYKNGRDSCTNTIRIRLTGLESSLFSRDTLTNNSFRSDSLFRLYLNGLGIIAQSGKGLMYISLTDTSTKLEMHYRRKNGGNIDTTYSSFKLATISYVDTAGKIVLYPSSTANNIVRNRLSLPSGNQELLLQAQPGTFADLYIDSLSNYSNRIIHRASIIVEQLPENTYYDSVMSAPSLLYIDLKDTTLTPKWKTIYFDLNPNTRYDPDYKSGLPFFPNGGVDFSYYGGYTRAKTNTQGVRAIYYDFNITKHVQQIVTKQTPNYHLRLFAPYNVSYPQYFDSYYTYGNRLALGRVKVAGGDHPTTKMRMVVIYSKIK